MDEGEEEEEVPTLADALAQLGLTDLTEKFTKEMIDFDSFVSLVVNSKIPTHSMTIPCRNQRLFRCVF